MDLSHGYLEIICFYLLSILPDYTHTTSSNYIVNPHPYGYRINNERLCERNLADVLIWVHTAPANSRRRMHIRQTWGNPMNFQKRKAALVFFLGMSNESEIQTMIEYESEIYKDIVQETFVDSYRNLTYKAIGGCKWTSTYCKSADLIIKADDDVIIDMYLLFRHIDSLRSRERVMSNTILCHVWYRSGASRTGKWMVTEKEYEEEFYPPYCSGVGFVMTADIIPKLYNASFYEPYLWIDDVYLTGLLGRSINVKFEQINSLVQFGAPKLLTKYQSRFSGTLFEHEYQWIIFHIKDQPAVKIWDAMLERELKRVQLGTPCPLL